MSTLSTIHSLLCTPPPRALLVNLLKEAHEALSEPLRTPLDKRGTAPSGNRQDYYSIGRYYWPSKNAKDPATWVHRDGEISADALAEGDFPAWCRMGELVETLALAWAYTGEERYAARAIQWIESWFINDESRLTPHFRYAAAAPGRHDGGGIGLIEAVEPLSWCLNGMAILKTSSFWHTKMDEAFNVWLSEFLQWITTHPKALPALRHPNNIGTWTETLVALVALYLENGSLISDRYLSIFPTRVSALLEEDGSQPGELTRTLSFHYSCYHMEAFLRWIELAARAGNGPERLPVETLARLRCGLLFLAKNDPWPYPNLGEVNRAKLHELISAYLSLCDANDHELAGYLARLPRATEGREGRRLLMGGAFYLIAPLPMLPALSI